jgi:hypothetical protein
MFLFEASIVKYAELLCSAFTMRHCRVLRPAANKELVRSLLREKLFRVRCSPAGPPSKAGFRGSD